MSATLVALALAWGFACRDDYAPLTFAHEDTPPLPAEPRSMVHDERPPLDETSRTWHQSRVVLALASEGIDQVIFDGVAVGVKDLPEDLGDDALQTLWAFVHVAPASVAFSASHVTSTESFVPWVVRRAGASITVERGQLTRWAPPLARTACSDRYQLHGILDGDAPWTDMERTALDAALALLTADERSVLPGLTFERRHDPIDRFAGAIFQGGDRPAVVLFDKGAAVDARRFVGSARAPLPMVSDTLLHELGHAFAESARQTLADLALRNSVTLPHGVHDRTMEVVARPMPTNEEDLLGDDQDTPDPAKLAYDRATRALLAHRSDFGARFQAYLTCDDCNVDMGAALEIERKALTQEQLMVDGLAEAQMSVEDRHFEALADARDHEVQRLSARELQCAARSRSAQMALRTADGVLAAYGEIPGAVPGPTAYAATDLGESFAESFAIWHTDPRALELIAPEVAAWFARGGHVAARARGWAESAAEVMAACGE